MLTIRKEQMAAFRKAGQNRFYLSLLHAVRSRYPDWLPASSETDRLSAIAQLCGKARSHGAFEPVQIMRFVLATVPYGSGFESHPDLAPILSNPDLTGRQKLDLLDLKCAAGTAEN